VVRTIADYYAPTPENKTKDPDAADFFHLKTSRFMAYALVHEYREHIAKAFDGFDMTEIGALDYAELNAV
jgi:hypothetical protein